MRDAATINQLAVLSNMESLNSELIKRGVALDERKKSYINQQRNN